MTLVTQSLRGVPRSLSESVGRRLQQVRDRYVMQRECGYSLLSELWREKGEEKGEEEREMRQERDAAATCSEEG